MIYRAAGALYRNGMTLQFPFGYGALVLSLRTRIIAVESRWFDLLYGTNTGATKTEVGSPDSNPGECFSYIPTRPSVARKIFRLLPIDKFEPFTFVDVGCGKGRMLLLAARYNFRAIVGLERDASLSAIAELNVAGLRDDRVVVQQIDARQYHFPVSPLVLYLFNPFGEQILEPFLANLEASVAANSRQVIIALLYPEYAYVLERFPRFRLVKETSKCRIYSC